jgi:hypothetical protein
VVRRLRGEEAPADSGDAQRRAILDDGLESLQLSPPSLIPSSRKLSPHAVTAQESRSSSLSSISSQIGSRDLEYIGHQDRYFNFQCGHSMMCGSSSNFWNEREGKGRALLDIGGLSV